MKTRKLLATALLLPLCAGVTTADAAKPKPKPIVRKPVCQLIKDAKDDATGTGTGQPGTNDPNLDMLSVDVATNATTLTVWFRMAATAPATDTDPNNTSRTGRGYTFTFYVNKKQYTLKSTVNGVADTWPTGGSGKVETTKKEVHVNVPLSSLTPPIKPNDKLMQMQATTWRFAGPVSLGLAEQASSTATYISGWPSCVKVGT